MDGQTVQLRNLIMIKKKIHQFKTENVFVH